MDYNIIPDQFSSEVISLMVMERLWTKVKRHLDNKAQKKEEDEMEKRLSKIEKDLAVNIAIDRHIRK